MNFYNYQRSRSFTVLCCGCLRFSTFIFSFKTAGLIETKLHVEPLWDWVMKVCSWDFGQTHYDKTPLKIFFSGLERPKTLKLGMQHWGLWPYQVYSNGNHWLTVIYFKYENNQLISRFKYWKTTLKVQSASSELKGQGFRSRLACPLEIWWVWWSMGLLFCG